MNKNGFTLMELLTAIVIIGIISLIAVPNMIGISEDIKKQTMLDDAKKFISLAKMKVNIDYEIRTFTKEGKCSANTCTLDLAYVDTNGEIMKDSDGENYDRASSYVRYSIVNSKVNYCVYLQGVKRVVAQNGACVNEDNLHSKRNVEDFGSA